MQVAQTFTTQVEATFNETTNQFRVIDAAGAEIQVGTMILIDSELMQVQYVAGNFLRVLRKQQDSLPTQHVVGATVHSGRVLVQRAQADSAAGAHAPEPETFTRVTKVSQTLVVPLNASVAPGCVLKIDCEYFGVEFVLSPGVLSVIGGYRGTYPTRHGSGAAVEVFEVLPALMSTGYQLPVTGETMLSSAVSRVQSRIEVASAAIVVVGSYIQVIDEIMLVQSVSNSTSNMFNVLRAERGSTAVAHIASSRVLAVRNGTAFGDSSPLKVDAFGFPIRRAGQATTFPLSENTITVTIMSNVAMHNYDSSDSALGSRFTLSGLTGASTPTGFVSISDVAGSGADTIFDSTGVWRREAGELVVVVAPNQVMEAGRVFTFSFSIVNGAMSQESPEIQVSARGNVALGYTLQLASSVERDWTKITFTEDPTYIFETNALLAMGSEIMLVSSFLSGNRILVTREKLGTTATNHSRGTTVFVLPVIDQATASDTSITVKERGGLGHLLGFQAEAFVRVEEEVVAIQEVEMNTMTVVRGQQGTAAAKHQQTSIVSLRLEVGGMTPDTSLLAAEPASVFGGASPLLTVSERFTVKSLTQSTSNPGELNELTLSIVANKHLFLGDASAVTISGLTGTRTQNA
eukprot:2523411-Rhodomonas_salina.1